MNLAAPRRIALLLLLSALPGPVQAAEKPQINVQELTLPHVMRWLLFERATSSISTLLLVIVVFWLAFLFFSFGLFGPSNSTALAALLVAALSVSGALFLILELDHPFGGMIRISSQPVLNVLNHLAR